MDSGIEHLTKVPRRYRLASWIDGLPVIGWVFGSVGVVWLPVVVGTVISVLLAYQVGYPALCWTASGLVGAQVLAGLVAHGAKRHREFSAGVVELIALRNFLDWMHAQVFTKNTSSRITIMVPIKRPGGDVLRSFLRPSAFPSSSETELAIQCNEGKVEGAAGVCYCEGIEHRMPISVDPDESQTALEEYARLSYMSPDKVRGLTRRARFYLALPIEATTGPHLGVLVVDNAKHPRIVDSEVKAASDRAEEQTKLFVGWVALQLKAIPAKIRERA